MAYQELSKKRAKEMQQQPKVSRRISQVHVQSCWQLQLFYSSEDLSRSFSWWPFKEKQMCQGFKFLLECHLQWLRFGSSVIFTWNYALFLDRRSLKFPSKHSKVKWIMEVISNQLLCLQTQQKQTWSQSSIHTLYNEDQLMEVSSFYKWLKILNWRTGY